MCQREAERRKWVQASCPLTSGNFFQLLYLTDLQKQLGKASELGGRYVEAISWVKSVEGGFTGATSSRGECTL